MLWAFLTVIVLLLMQVCRIGLTLNRNVWAIAERLAREARRKR